MYTIEKKTYDEDGKNVTNTIIDNNYYDDYKTAMQCCHEWALNDVNMTNGESCNLIPTKTYDAIIISPYGTTKYTYAILELVKAKPQIS